MSPLWAQTGSRVPKHHALGLTDGDSGPLHVGGRGRSRSAPVSSGQRWEPSRGQQRGPHASPINDKPQAAAGEGRDAGTQETPRVAAPTPPGAGSHGSHGERHGFTYRSPTSRRNPPVATVEPGMHMCAHEPKKQVSAPLPAEQAVETASPSLRRKQVMVKRGRR